MDRSRALPLLLAFGWMACKGSTLKHIEIEEGASTTIEGSSLLDEVLDTVGFDGFTEVDITANQELQNQGVAPGDISSVALVTFELEAVSGDMDLAFLESMSIYASAPGLDTVLVASQSDFPAGQAVVAFDLEDVDLVDYAVSESMTFTTEVTAEAPEDDTKVEARVLIDVGVTVQGACAYLQSEDTGA